MRATYLVGSCTCPVPCCWHAHDYTSQVTRADQLHAHAACMRSRWLLACIKSHRDKLHTVWTNDIQNLTGQSLTACSYVHVQPARGAILETASSSNSRLTAKSAYPTTPSLMTGVRSCRHDVSCHFFELTARVCLAVLRVPFVHAPSRASILHFMTHALAACAAYRLFRCLHIQLCKGICHGKAHFLILCALLAANSIL